MVVIGPSGIGAAKSMMGRHTNGFSGCHALVLDPNVNNRRLLQATLQDLRCSEVVGTGEEDDAWAELGKGGVNVLFLDWSEAMDAPAILTRLRGPECPERYVPVVVVTGYGEPEDVRRVRDAGATEFILRPFCKEVVTSRLRSIVRMPRQFVASDSYFGPDRRRHHQDWPGQERRHDRHDADRRNHPNPAYAGPERRLERVADPPAPALSPSPATTMCKSREKVWQS